MTEKVPSILLRALEASAKALDHQLVHNLEKQIANGHLLLKLLDKDYQIDKSSGAIGEDKIWCKIKNRIEEIFAPDLIKWEEAKRYVDENLQCEIYNKDQLALALLALFVCCVFDQNKDVYGALYLLDEKTQQRIRFAFQHLIENRPGMTRNKLELILKSLSDDWKGNPPILSNPCRSTTALTSTSLLCSSISGSDVTTETSSGNIGDFDSFTYSPIRGKACCGTPKMSITSPLQDFMRSQTTNQIVKYQKIMEEQKRKMRDIQVGLDQEKSETLFLRKEVEGLQSDRERLKKSLEEARQNLFRQSNLSFNESSGSCESVEIKEIERKDALLRMSMADKKDSDKYVKKLELELRQTSEHNRELKARFEAQKDKMAESSKLNVKLVTQVVEYQESITSLSGENTKVKEENQELAAQVTQLGDILRENRNNFSTKQSMDRKYTAPSFDNISINDISMDDPQGSTTVATPLMFKSSTPSTAAEEENIGRTVVLELKMDLEKLTEENKNLIDMYSESVKKCTRWENLLVDKDLKYKELTLEFKKQLANVDAEIKGLTKSLDDKKKELEMCKGENADSKANNDALQKESRKMFHVKSELIDKVNNLQKTLLELECKIQENEATIGLKKKEIKDAAQKHEKHQNEIASLKIEVSALNNELVLCNESQSKILDLNNELRGSLNDKEMNIEHCQSIVDEKIQENKNITETHYTTVAKYTEKVEEMANHAEVQKNDLANARLKNEEFSAENSLLKTEIDKTKCEKHELLKEKSDLEMDKNRALQLQTNEFTARIAILEKNLNATCTEKEVFNEQFDELSSKHSILTGENKDLKELKIKFEEEIEELREKTTLQENEILEKENTLGTKVQQLKEAEIKLDAAVTNASADLLKYETNVEELCYQVSKLKSDIEVVNLAKEELSTQHHHIKEQANILDTEKQILLTERELLLKENDTKLDVQNDRFETKIKMLTIELNKINEEQEIYKKELNEEKENNETRERQYKALQVNNDKLKIVLVGCQTTVNEQEHEVEQNKKTLFATQKELEKLKVVFNDSIKKSSLETAESKACIEMLSLRIDERDNELESVTTIKEQLSLENIKIKNFVESSENAKDALIIEQKEMVKKEKDNLSVQKERNNVEIKELQQQLDGNKMELEYYKNELDAVNKDFHEIVLLKEQYAIENSDIKGRIHKNETDMQDLLGEKEALEVDKDEKLASQEKCFKIEINDLTRVIEENRKEMELCKNELTVMGQKVIQLEGQLIESQDSKSELQVKNNEIARHLQAKQLEINRNEELLVTKDSETENLKKKYDAAIEISSSELADSTKRISELSEHANNLRAESKDALSIKEQLETENKELQSSVYELGKVKDSLLEENKKIVSENEDKLAVQKEKFEGKLKNIAALANKQYKQNLEKGLSQLNRSIETRDKMIEENKLKFERLKGNMHDLESVSGKYEVAKTKLKEMLDVLEQERKDRNLIEGQYQASKETIRKLHVENTRIKSELKTTSSQGKFAELKNDNDSLKCQIKQVVSENRSLKVQVTHANTQIRELQSDHHQMIGGGRRKQAIHSAEELASTRSLDRRQTLAAGPSVPCKINTGTNNHNTNDVFKMPSERRILPPAHNTPGRTKAGRTQSEAALARRPPTGSGSMFMTDDEAGEMFSSSYLSDMKDGKCNPFGNVSANNSGFDRRLSELSRRNTMVPAHLKSSYPAETQFFNLKEFDDTDLQHGRLTNIMPSEKKSSDINDITYKASKLSVDSPAMNTRNKQKPIAFTIQISDANETEKDDPGTPALTLEEALKLSPPCQIVSKKAVKRQSSGSVLSVHSSGMNDSRDSGKNWNKSSISTDRVKRAKKDHHSVSYSRPGPPTPARLKGNKSICSNTSLESAGDLNTSVVSSHNRSIASTRRNIVVTGSSEYSTPIFKGKKRGDKTPLLDTTNQSSTQASARSNRSLKSFGKGTPMSLKKVMTRAFGRRKPEKKKAGDSVIKGDKTIVITPKKRLKL